MKALAAGVDVRLMVSLVLGSTLTYLVAKKEEDVYQEKEVDKYNMFLALMF
ncbi:hypothetical protein RchiOBHm_Chr1g0352491 [Rosa chinensis]|uniref:Uncharacterized protein n=1 Tax=Rosa chinensis TaxID=74649 RepID=A0A2P6SGN0_ROSCH|nr:hypothetical protein RchiOBHm_Chr1g0352491 [Rosa chinensis]